MATTYTSATTGNWSSSSTWTPTGVPGNGDTAQLQHAVTVDVATIVGTSPVAGQAGAGTVTAASSTTVTGTGTAFTTQLKVGDLLTVSGGLYVVTAIASDTSLTVGRSMNVSGVSFTFTPCAVTLQGTAARLIVNAPLAIRGAFSQHFPLSTKTDTVTVAAGQGIEIDASQASPTTQVYPIVMIAANSQFLRWVFNGTSGSRCYLRSNAGGGNSYLTLGGSSIGGWLNAAYTDFSRLYDGSTYAFDFYLGNTPSAELTLSHCTWDSACGQVGNTTQANSGATLSVTNSQFNNTANATSFLVAGGSAPTGTRAITGNSFAGTAQFNTPYGFTITGNYFANSFAITGSGASWSSFSGNFVAQSAVTTNARSVGDVVGNYFGWGTSFTGSNPHFLDPGALNTVNNSVDSNIFEYFNADQTGDTVIFNSAPTVAITVNVTRNILVPNAAGEGHGELISPIVSSSNYTIVAENNSVTSTNAQTITEQGVAVYGETYAGRANLYTSVRANLAYTPSGKNPGVVFLRHNQGTVSDGCTAANADYNGANSLVSAPGTNVDAVYGPHGGYLDDVSSPSAAMFSSGTPGAHDVYADPQLVDPSRNLQKWYAAPVASGGYGGTDQGSYNANVTAALSAISADTTQIARLISYVRAGWRPTNSVYTQAAVGRLTTLSADAAGNAWPGGSPGIGAMAVQSSLSRRTLYDRAGSRGVA